MSGLRAFIAIPLPQEIHSKLELLETQLKDQGIRSVRWVSTNNIHLTLHFLGEISPSIVTTLTQSLKPVVAVQEEFTIEIGNLGTFPNNRQPRIIWTGVQRSAQLNILYSLIGRVVEQTGISIEKRPFSPHLTMGRVKHDASTTEIQHLSEVVTRINIGSIGILRVNMVTLFRSELLPQGPVYTPLAHFTLQN